MMKRLYYLADSIESADETVDDLHQAGINDHSLHVLGRDKKMIIDHKLHIASPFQELDISYFAMIGAAIGGCIAFGIFVTLILGQLFVLNPIAPILLILMVLVLISIGTLLGGGYGLTVENHHITRFSEQLSNGKYLLMIDIVARYENATKSRVKSHKGVWEAGSEDLLVPAFA